MEVPMESRKSASRTGRNAQDPQMVSSEEISGWITGRLPENWFEKAPTITIDNDEILIVGQLPAPHVGDGADPAAEAAAEAGRISRVGGGTRRGDRRHPRR